MARIIGIDLGSYSVKMVLVSPGIRTSNVVDYVERVIPPGEEPLEIRAARVAGEVVRTHQLSHDTPYVGVGGDQVFIHILDMPFRGLRRPDLEKAVGAELEGILPIDLEDMVYAFEPLPRDIRTTPRAPSSGVGALVDDDEPTFVGGGAPLPQGTQVGRVAAPTEGTRVLACAMSADKARGFLSQLEGQGIEPRGMIAVPGAYRRIAERVGAFQASKHGGAYTAFIDIGHTRTNLCVVIDDKVDFIRTVGRGGRDLTQAIAVAWRLPWEQAEDAKHTSGFIASTAMPALSEAAQRVHTALEPVMGPMARQLRRTFQACRAKTGATVGQAVLVGGGSQIEGMAEYLAEQLGMPVARLTAEDGAAIVGAKLAARGVRADVACVAAGIGIEAGAGRAQFDLRQGELAYKADLSFLRAKVGMLIASSLVIIAFAAGSAYASLYKLRQAEAVLDERLALESTAAFGEAIDAEEVLERIGPARDQPRSPIPAMTAYDTLIGLNATMPSREEATFDIHDLDIKGDKITIKGSSSPTDKGDALAGIDKWEQALKESACFKDYTPGETQPGANDTREFSMTIKSSCTK